MADNDAFGPAEDGAPDWAQGFGAGHPADSVPQDPSSEGRARPGPLDRSRGADQPDAPFGADASPDEASQPPQKRRWRRERDPKPADPTGAEAIVEEPAAAVPPPPPRSRRSRLRRRDAAAAETDAASEDPDLADPDKASGKKSLRLPKRPQLRSKRSKAASETPKVKTGDEPAEPEYKLPRGKWKVAIWDGRSVILVRGKGRQISRPPDEQAYENSGLALAAALKASPRLVVAASQPLEQASSAETRFAHSDRPDEEMPKRGRRLREAAHLIDVFGKNSAVVTFGAVSATLPEVTKRQHGKSKFTLAACSVGHEDGVHVYLGLESSTLVLINRQRIIEYGQIDTGLNSSEMTGPEAAHGPRNALAHIAETVGEEAQRLVSTWSARHGLIRSAYLTGPGAQQWQTIAASIQSAAGLTARAAAPQLEVEVDAWLPVAAVAGYGLNAPRFGFPHRLPRRQTIRKHSLRAAFVVGVLAVMLALRSHSQSEGERIAAEAAAIEQQAAEVTAFTATIETPEETANRALAAEADAAEQVAARWLLDGSYEPEEYPVWERALTEIGGGNTLTRQQIRLPSLRSPESAWGNSLRWQPIPLRWSMGVLGETFTLSAGSTQANSDSDSRPVDWPSSRQEVPASRWDLDVGAFE